MGTLPFHTVSVGWEFRSVLAGSSGLRAFVRLQVKCGLKAQSSVGCLGLENLPPRWWLLMASRLVLAVGRGPQVFAKCTSPLDSFGVLTQLTAGFLQSK